LGKASVFERNPLAGWRKTISVYAAVAIIPGKTMLISGATLLIHAATATHEAGTSLV